MPKERFELSRALCPLRPERSVLPFHHFGVETYFTQFFCQMATEDSGKVQGVAEALAQNLYFNT